MYSSGAGLLIKGIFIFSAILVPTFKTKRIKPLIHSGLNNYMISARDSTENHGHRRWHNFHTLSTLYKKYQLNRKWLLQVRKVKQHFYHSILPFCQILTWPISPRVCPSFWWLLVTFFRKDLLVTEMWKTINTITNQLKRRLINGKELRYNFLAEIVNWAKLNGILLPKLFSPTVRKNCSSDREKLLKFEAEG